MKIIKQKTPLSCIWQIRLFGIDYLCGYVRIKDVADYGVDNANILETRARYQTDSHQSGEMIKD